MIFLQSFNSVIFEKEKSSYIHTVDLTICGCNMHGSVSCRSFCVQVYIDGCQPPDNIYSTLLYRNM